MKGRRHRGLVFCVAIVVALMVATAAWATKPITTPWNPPPTALEPGQACAFNVTIESLDGNWTETLYPDGSALYRSAGRDRATNTDKGGSIKLATSGTIRLTPLADGATRLKASGRTLFYFWAGDQGPYGEVGPNGALYYIVGNVKETLDADFVVTSFEWTGRATESCSKID